MVNTILENLSLIILDQYAAYQATLFRKKFYRELIPRLKSQTKPSVSIKRLTLQSSTDGNFVNVRADCSDLTRETLWPKITHPNNVDIPLY